MASEIHFGRHVIRSAKVKGGWSAHAFEDNMPLSVIFYSSSEEEAILKVKNALEARQTDLIAQRSSDGFPNADEVRAAFAHIEVNAIQAAMLLEHIQAPGHILTATELAEAVGYDNFTLANNQYGFLGRQLAEELDWSPPTLDGDPMWTLALATGVDNHVHAERWEMAQAHWRWKLRPQVTAAIQD